MAAAGNRPSVTVALKILRSLFLSGTVLAVSVTFAAGIQASEQPASAMENVDARWLPWIGSWKLVSNAVNTSESPSREEYMLTIAPGDDGKSVTRKAYLEDAVLSEKKIAADGLRQPLTEDECTGWYQYSWSETGKRLLFKSESTCQDNLPRMASGMWIINGDGEWLDIQSLYSGEEKAVMMRRYQHADSDPVTSDRVNGVFARISAGAEFSNSEIIELCKKVEPEVLEAAIIEMHKPFLINSKQLVILANSGVPSNIVDLMVALSFPDKFKVERTAISQVETPELRQDYPPPPPPYRYWPYEYPFYTWHWGASVYWPYDYWYLGWDMWPGWRYSYWYYPYWWYPYSGGGSYPSDVGRLVEGRGYTRVSTGNSGTSTRRAQPRMAPERTNMEGRSATGSSSGLSSSGWSSGSSGSYSGGSSAGSSGKTPCASPGGYSSGNCD